jgi:hypothetical protein
MAYVDPNTVQSPKGLVENIDVVYDKGPVESSWSIAKLKWDKKPSVGIRWNGEMNQPGCGTPQSRGNATWFILPDELAASVLEAANKLEAAKEAEILRGYEEMAADTAGEKEAFDWIEAHVGECL